MKQVSYLNPFGRFCCTIGNLPTSYMESLTYEQQLLWFLKFLDEKVIPAVNTNADAIVELQNYLKNLDLQDEVNNKLDEMAESGELTEIIAQYLQLAGLLCYNTVADLKNSTNITAGSFVKTYGFHTHNDAGGAFYKIREITNSDQVDDITIIALSNFENLIAELIPVFNMSVKQFGAYGDGLHDDTNSIKKAITYFNFGTVNFGSGTYLISESIKTYVDNDNQVNLNLEKTTIIKSLQPLNSIFELGGLGGNNEGVQKRLRYFKGGIIDASNCVCGIKINENAMGITIEDTEINNFTTYGIYSPKGETVFSSDLYIANSYINGISSNDNNYGIYLERPDNTIFNVRINAIKTAIFTSGSGLNLSNIHALGIGSDNWFNDTVFVEINNAISISMDQCYNDTLQTYVKTVGNCNFSITDSLYFSYLENINTKLFILSNQTSCIIKNNKFQLPNPLSKNQGLIVNNFNDQLFLRSSNLMIEDNIFTNINSLINGDLLFLTNKSYQPFWLASNTFLDNNNWTKIGYLLASNNYINLNLQIEGYKFETIFKLERYDPETLITSRPSIKSDSNYTLDLGVKYVGNDNGYNVYEVYIKQNSGTNLKTDIIINNLNKCAPFIPLSNEILNPSYESLSMDYQITI